MSEAERQHAAERTGLPSDLACFEAGGAVWGIDVRCVRRIVRGGEIRPLPGAPAFIVGVLDLDESLVPVLDLGCVLGAGSSATFARAGAVGGGDFVSSQPARERAGAVGGGDFDSSQPARERAGAVGGGDLVSFQPARERIVVVECGGRVLGLRVGRAAEVLSLDGRRCEPAPSLARDAGYDAVDSLVRRDDGRPVLVLALDRVLERLIRTAAPEEARP